MLAELQARRDELVNQCKILDEKSKAAESDAEREAIDAEAWLIVARVWLYRGTGLVALSNHKGQISGYLDYHIKEAKKDIKDGYNVDGNRALLDECRIAKRILRKAQDVPLF